MAKDPAVLFYTSDFLASTYHLNNEQVGVFIRLLCIQHLHGRISFEDMPSAENKDNKKILDMFVCDENGYYNERMEEEILKRKSFCKSRKENKEKADQKRKEAEIKDKASTEKATITKEKAPVTKEKAPVPIGEKAAEDKEPKMKNEGNRQRERERLSQDFNRFWSAYPKKVAKVYCEKIFYKLKPSTELTDQMIKALENQRKWEMWQRESGKYIPNPSTWLSQQRWLDEANYTVCQQNNETKRIGIYL